MATDKYPKQTTVRLTEGEHRALTGEAERHGMSLSRYLAMAGHLVSDQLAGEYLEAKREAVQAEQTRQETEELEELHRQMKRAGRSLWSLLEEVRSGGSSGDGASGGGPAALEETARKIDRATGEVLKKLS